MTTKVLDPRARRILWLARLGSIPKIDGRHGEPHCQGRLAIVRANASLAERSVDLLAA